MLTHALKPLPVSLHEETAIATFSPLQTRLSFVYKVNT